MKEMYVCEQCKNKVEKTFTCINCSKEICFNCMYSLGDYQTRCPECYDHLLWYKGMPFDDHTENEDDTVWSQVCNSCISKYNIDEKLLDEAGSGICGIEGCENESDHYIDFPDNHDWGKLQ